MAKGIEIRDAHFPGRAPIDAYGNGGFRFADMSHRGSILCLPSGIHGWEPKTPPILTAADLSLVLEQAADIEILLVGTGTELRRLPQELRDELRKHRISVRSDEHRRGSANLQCSAGGRSRCRRSADCGGIIGASAISHPHERQRNPLHAIPAGCGS